MCTLVVAFYQQTKTPLVIASNRDENPTRPTSPWDIRQFKDDEYYHKTLKSVIPDGLSKDDPYYSELLDTILPKVYCPLDDVLGGTWIGINTAGVFCALTNWDLEENFHGRGLQSRGHVVLNSLKRCSIKDVVRYWCELDAKNHKPFNIIAGDVNELYNLRCDNKELIITKLRAGVHISTGMGFNESVPRDLYIRQQLPKYTYDLSQPIRPDVLLGLMGSHNCGIGSEDSVCVHDEEHRWETRSTALIVNNENAWSIMTKDGPACHESPWTSKIVKLEK